MRPNKRCDSTSTNKINDLDAIAVVHQGVGKKLTLENCEVVLDSYAPRVDRELRQQVGDRQRLLEFVGLAVERDEQGAWLREPPQRTARALVKSS